jgi:hypothetical protein
MKRHDVELMQQADGELGQDDLLREPGAREKVEAVRELGELVRGHVELQADHVPVRRFDAIWREIDKAIDRAPVTRQPTEETKVGHAHRGLLRRLSRWFDLYRGHVITGAVSAGAVAALALVLRGPGDGGKGAGGTGAIPTQPMTYRPTEIQELNTPGGTGSVFHLEDEDGTTTVIWVTPEDTVEGI